jgi:hypothetical protein
MSAKDPDIPDQALQQRGMRSGWMTGFIGATPLRRQIIPMSTVVQFPLFSRQITAAKICFEFRVPTVHIFFTNLPASA